MFPLCKMRSMYYGFNNRGGGGMEHVYKEVRFAENELDNFGKEVTIEIFSYFCKPLSAEQEPL